MIGISSGYLALRIAVAYSPNGVHLVLAYESWIQIWDVASGNCVAEMKFDIEIFYAKVLCITYSSDGTRIASGYQFCGIGVWDATNGALLWKLTEDFPYEKSFSSILYSSDGTRLITNVKPHTITIFDAASGAQLKELKGHTAPIHCIAGHPTECNIVSASGDVPFEYGTIAMSLCRPLTSETLV